MSIPWGKPLHRELKKLDLDTLVGQCNKLVYTVEVLGVGFGVTRAAEVAMLQSASFTNDGLITTCKNK